MEAFAKLYRSENITDISRVKLYLSGIDTPSLSEHQREDIDREIEVTDLKEALDSFDGNTAPGEDGLPFEVYRRYEVALLPMLLEVLNISLKEGKLPQSMCEAIITLVLKKN